MTVFAFTQCGIQLRPRMIGGDPAATIDLPPDQFFRRRYGSAFPNTANILPHAFSACASL